MNSRDKLPLLDTEISLLTIEDILAIIRETVSAKGKTIIANHNLHSLYLACCQRDPGMRDFYSASEHVYIDGLPIVLIAKIFGLPALRNHRCAFLDWLHPMLDNAAAAGWKVFSLGCDPGVGTTAAERLRAAHPGLMIEARDGFFNSAAGNKENASVVEHINGYGPRILLVGMGMPRQERWIIENISNLRAEVIITCGATMEFVAGHAALPPRLLGRLGFEWLFRLATNPRRLWRRYLLEPWAVFGAVIRHLLSRTP